MVTNMKEYDWDCYQANVTVFITARCRHNAVNCHKNIEKRHPIARPLAPADDLCLLYMGLSPGVRLDKYFHSIFYSGFNYLSVLRYKINHGSKRVPGGQC